MCSTETFRKSRLLSVLFYDDSTVSLGSAIGHTILPNQKMGLYKNCQWTSSQTPCDGIKRKLLREFHIIKHRFCSTHLV